jgi:hypothetical protein
VSLADGLMEHARALLVGSPNEAHLRRAVSAAYYALFHLLSSAVAEQVSPDLPVGLRGRTQRALDHGTMANAASQFKRPGERPQSLPKDIVLEPISQRLVNVAASFVDLQEARYLADYDALDSTSRVSLQWAQENVSKAESAFRDWNVVKRSEEAKVFLAALMFAQRWNRKADSKS